MSAQIVGIVLTAFSILVAAVITWGGFAEEKRGNDDSAAALANR